MNRIITLILLSTAFISVAQQTQRNIPANVTASIPVGYYNTATGTGYTLKTQLHNIIDNHTDNGYAGLYVTYQTSDVRPTGKVWDMYSDCVFTFGTVANGGNQDNGSNPAGECVFFNREHTVPQSYFGAGVQPMYSDAHFVLPTDKVVNATRNDYPYGVVPNPTWTSTNGSKLGNNSNSGYAAGYSQTVFEPVDEYKGDIARLLLYFAVRYEDQLTAFYTSSTSTAKVMFDGTSDHTFSNTFLSILLKWHQQDPVSAKEITRNDAIYARQDNRNPFIDHPEYACIIWPAACAALGTPDIELAAISVYPNPSNTHKINIESEVGIDDIQLITINGQLLMEVKNPVFDHHSYTIENLPQGFYFLKLSSGGISTTKKIIIN